MRWRTDFGRAKNPPLALCRARILAVTESVSAGRAETEGGNPSLERPCSIPLTPKRAVGALLRAALLAQQREHALWELIRLRHHGSAGLLQDLRARQVGSFQRKVRILNPGA